MGILLLFKHGQAEQKKKGHLSEVMNYSMIQYNSGTNQSENDGSQHMCTNNVPGTENF